MSGTVNRSSGKSQPQAYRILSQLSFLTLYFMTLCTTLFTEHCTMSQSTDLFINITINNLHPPEDILMELILIRQSIWEDLICILLAYTFILSETMQLLSQLFFLFQATLPHLTIPEFLFLFQDSILFQTMIFTIMTLHATLANMSCTGIFYFKPEKILNKNLKIYESNYQYLDIF